MGTGASRRKTRVTPVATISVQPRAAPNENDSSLENTQDGSPAGGSREKRGSTENTSKISGSRSASRESRRSSLSNSMRVRVGSAHRRQMSGVTRTSGSHSRPISSVSGQHVHSAKAVSIRKGKMASGFERMSGIPFQRDIDLNASGRSQRTTHTALAIAPDSDLGMVVVLKTDANREYDYPATCCQLCGLEFTNLGIRVPLLLLCGHSYCSSCLEKACENYPSALKCGICSIVTPLDQQTFEILPQNESILDLLGSKEFSAISNKNHVENCAECDRRPASVYCSECSASYCNYCNRQSHEGSRVRAKHRPVPINLKPRPQPTCKKHPGQSCVLYCETEKQPMCVLCKFYGQHRFHRYELMSKVASKYCSSVSEKMGQLDKMEEELDDLVKSLAQSVEEIDTGARKAQDRLEKHFAELRKSYLASLERREAVLLTLVDRQVEMKQEMLEEMRKEVAAARARLLAAKEEASRLYKLNPVLALLSRRHMDASFDLALKQTVKSLQVPISVDIPLSLIPDITPSMVQLLNQHGAILQFPPKPEFTDVSVTNSAISLQWETDSDFMTDRTLTYSLHCYADVPFKMKAKINFKKRLLGIGKLSTPESGFEDMSEYSADSGDPTASFPSLPASLLGSQNISLVTLGTGNKHADTAASHEKSLDLNSAQAAEEQAIIDREIKRLEEEQGKLGETPAARSRSESPAKPGLVLKPTGAKNISNLLPEPIRLPKPLAKDKTMESKLPQLVNPSRGSTRPPPTTTTTQANAAVLNLPPLVIAKPKNKDSNLTELPSDSMTSGFVADSEDASTPLTSKQDAHEDGASDITKTLRSSSCSTLSVTSSESQGNQFTNMERFLKGYAFEEIYCGEKNNFHYSGLVAGATYYFRLRCHNAAGWGPWSDTVKCMTTSGKGLQS